MAIDKEKLRQRLVKIFIGELDRYVETLGADLNGLDGLAPGPELTERIDRLHRDTHGLKGAARSAGLPALQRSCLALELQLVEVRDGRCALDSALVDLLREALPAFRESSERLHAEQEQAGPLLDGLLKRLETRSASA